MDDEIIMDDDDIDDESIVSPLALKVTLGSFQEHQRHQRRQQHQHRQLHGTDWNEGSNKAFNGGSDDDDDDDYDDDRGPETRLVDDEECCIIINMGSTTPATAATNVKDKEKGQHGLKQTMEQLQSRSVSTKLWLSLGLAVLLVVALTVPMMISFFRNDGDNSSNMAVALHSQVEMPIELTARMDPPL